MSVPPCSIPSQFRGQGTRCATRKSMRPRTCTDVGDGGEEKARAAPAAPGQSSALESGDLPTLTALLPPAASVSTHRRRVTQLRFWVQRSERTSFQRKKERARDTEIQMSPSGKENPSFELGVGRACISAVLHGGKSKGNPSTSRLVRFQTPFLVTRVSFKPIPISPSSAPLLSKFPGPSILPLSVLSSEASF